MSYCSETDAIGLFRPHLRRRFVVFGLDLILEPSERNNRERLYVRRAEVTTSHGMASAQLR